jgi:hypothetical protein
MAYSLVPDANNTVGSDLTAMYDNFVALESAQIVDSGSTADGDYWRFEDGLQICTATNTLELLQTGPDGVVYFPFPQSFTIVLGGGAPNAILPSIGIGRDVIPNIGYSLTANGWGFATNQTIAINKAVDLLLFAIGRWK